MERDEVRVMFGDLVFEVRKHLRLGRRDVRYLITQVGLAQMLFNAYTTLEQQQNNQTPIVATTPQQAATSGCRC